MSVMSLLVMYRSLAHFTFWHNSLKGTPPTPSKPSSANQVLRSSSAHCCVRRVRLQAWSSNDWNYRVTGHREFSQWWRSLLVVRAARLLFFVVQARARSEAWRLLQAQCQKKFRRFDALIFLLKAFEALLLLTNLLTETEALPTTWPFFAPFRFTCGGCYECLEGPSCLYNRLASELPQQGQHCSTSYP